MNDVIEWRGLRLERRKEYPEERYDYVAEGGAYWIVERLERSEVWLAWFLAGDRTRFMSKGKTAAAALEAVYADIMQLGRQLQQALREID